MESHKKDKLAIFDIDGTLYKSAFGVEFLRALVGAGLVDSADFADNYTEWLHADNAGRRLLFNEKFRSLYATKLVGISRLLMQKAVDVLLDQEVSNVYPEVHAELVELRGSGYRTLALSYSPMIIVSSFAWRLGFDDCIAPDFVFDENDNYIRSAEFTYDKAVHIKEYAARTALGFDKSVGFGDRLDDLPILEAVSRSVVNRPEPALRAIAIERDWTIFDDK